MIKCGNLMLSDDTEKYWNRCYTVRNEYVPAYLEKFKEIILRTGKYLNALYHCSKLNELVEQINYNNKKFLVQKAKNLKKYNFF